MNPQDGLNGGFPNLAHFVQSTSQIPIQPNAPIHAQNFYAPSSTTPGDGSFSQNLPMTPQAFQNWVYMSLAAAGMGQMPQNMAQGQSFPLAAAQFMTAPGLTPQAGFPGMLPQQINMPYSQVQPMDSGSSVQATGHQSLVAGRRESAPGSGFLVVHAGKQLILVIDTFRGSPMEEDEHSSRKYKASSLGPSFSSKKKGKSRGDERPSKRSRYSDSSDDEGYPAPATHNRPSSGKDTNGIFVKETGEPYKLYVQVEMRNRSKTADIIKVRRITSPGMKMCS